MGQSSEIGLYDVPCEIALFGLRMGMMVDCFHMLGMTQVVSEMLKSLLINVWAPGPRCLRCVVVMLSGPGAVEFLALLMAFATCCGVQVLALRRSIFLMCRLCWRSCLVLVILNTLVYCLLNWLAIDLLVVWTELLKDMEVFGGLDLLPLSALMVFQSLCELVL